MGFTNVIDSNILSLLELNKNSNNVHVFITEMDKYKRNIPQFWACLSTKEQKRAKQYYTNLLTNRYIIAHGVLRYILSYYTGLLPQDLAFIYNKYDKPFLKNCNKSIIQFNISHSHNIVCYAIAYSDKIGIDIERYEDDLDIMPLLDLVLTQQESKFFNVCNNKIKIFYSIWTQKEALIKAIGQGLSYPINTINVLNFLFDNKVVMNNNGYQQKLYIYTLEVPINYFGAIAIDAKINKIVYIESSNQLGIFDKIRFGV